MEIADTSFKQPKAWPKYWVAYREMCTWNLYFQKNSKRKQKWKKTWKKTCDFFALQNVKKVYTSEVETESYNLRRKAFFFKKLNQTVQNNKSQS